jgi:putative ABC transport system permease protein
MVGGMLARKLLRDIRHSAGQFAAVAAVVACGMVVFISQRSAYQSLLASRDDYYERYRFADFFVHLEKAPESALNDVLSIEGVLRARGRIVEDVPLELEGNDGAVVGRVISMPDRRDGLINDIHMVSGSYFPGASAIEVIVNDRFCQANALRIGDSFQATINERKEDLRIVGTAYSPEYVYAVSSPQQFAPNDEEFAIIFARESFVEDAFNMTNAFNDLVGLLRPGANVDDVLDEVKVRLDQYGVYHKYGRDQQLSNHYLAEELRGLRNSALVTPMVFLVVAAVVIHVLLRRMTELQRTQIGLLCALGYTKLRVVAHYVAYAVAIALAGAVPGTVLGYVLGAQWTQMYNLFFRLPELRTQFSPTTVLNAFLLSAGMCAIGAGRSAARILRLEPAVAIRPQPPAAARAFHEGGWRLLWDRLPLTWRINLRNTLRARHRSFSTVGGVAVAVVILMLGTAMKDWMDYIIHFQFNLVDRSDLHVNFATERSRAAVFDLASVAGVRRAEGILQFGAELRNGWRTKTVLVLGLPQGSRLYRIYDTRGRRVRLPEDGLVVPERLAKALGLSPGSRVLMDPYLRDKDERFATVRAVVDQYIGLSVFTTREFLAELLGESGAVNGSLIRAEPGAIGPLAGELDDIPGVQAVTATGAILGGFEETVSDLMRLSVFILGFFAAVIAFAVIYNASSVNIAEQERDLACMRSLGFEQEAVAQVATNDIMPLGLIGTCVGLPLGVLLCHGLSRLYETDLYKLPVVIEPDTYAIVVALVLVFQLAARWVCRRRIRKIDIVRRLKTLE